MGRYLVRRAVQGIATMFAVVTLTFLLLHLAPGDPVDALTSDTRVPDSVRAQLRANYGLDQPLAIQYARYLAAVGRGNLGFSLSQLRPVAGVLRDALPNTLLLMLVALGIAFTGGTALGAWQGVRAGSRLERVTGVITMALATLPDFWLASGAMLLLAARWQYFPTGGMVDPVMHPLLTPSGRVVDVARHLVLPAACLGAIALAVVARFQRAAMLDVREREFLRTAAASGVSARRRDYHHALRNALLPTVTLFGLALPTLFGGALFIEAVFAWPGVGRAVADGVMLRDYPLVLAAVMVISALVVAGGVVADLLHAALDPRVRIG